MSNNLAWLVYMFRSWIGSQTLEIQKEQLLFLDIQYYISECHVRIYQKKQ